MMCCRDLRRWTPGGRSVLSRSRWLEEGRPKGVRRVVGRTPRSTTTNWEGDRGGRIPRVRGVWSEVRLEWSWGDRASIPTPFCLIWDRPFSVKSVTCQSKCTVEPVRSQGSVGLRVNWHSFLIGSIKPAGLCKSIFWYSRLDFCLLRRTPDVAVEDGLSKVGLEGFERMIRGC